MPKRMQASRITAAGALAASAAAEPLEADLILLAHQLANAAAEVTTKYFRC